MGRISALIAALVLLVAGSAAAQDAMKAFSPPNGRFTVMMPGTPQSANDSIKQTDGETTIGYRFWVTTDDGAVVYMLMYNDDVKPQGSPQARLEASRDGVVKSVEGTLLSDHAISLNGISGRAYTARSTKDGALYDIQSYYTGRRLYQVLALTSAGKTAAFRDAYMTSFRILPDAPPRGK